MELSMTDLRELLGATAATTPESSPGVDPADPQPGDAVLIRTVTMIFTGRVVTVGPCWIVLDESAWIADTGRWSAAIATGTLSEVEPSGDGVLVARASIVDVTPWRHPLPREAK